VQIDARIAVHFSEQPAPTSRGITGVQMFKGFSLRDSFGKPQPKFFQHICKVPNSNVLFCTVALARFVAKHSAARALFKPALN